MPSPPLSPSPARRERGIMECGSEASAHAEASASALQKRWHAAPLSHAVGEGAGVRAKERARLAHSELKRCTLIRERAGSGGILHAQQFVNFDGAIGIIPIARAEFTIAPLRRFPPLREGNRVGRVGSVPPACRGNLKEGVIGHTRFCELWLRDWYKTNCAFGMHTLPP